MRLSASAARPEERRRALLNSLSPSADRRWVVSNSTWLGWAIGSGTMIPRAILACALSLLIGGCAYWQATADSWKGRPLDELIYAWGPPAEAHELNDGRRTALFRHSRLSDGTEYYCDVSFSADEQGTIVFAQVEGNLGGCNRFFATKGTPR